MRKQDVLFEKILARKTTFGGALVQTGIDCMLAKMIDRVHWLQAEDTLRLQLECVRQHADPFSIVIAVYTSLMSLPVRSVLEGFDTYSAGESVLRFLETGTGRGLLWSHRQVLARAVLLSLSVIPPTFALWHGSFLQSGRTERFLTRWVCCRMLVDLSFSVLIAVWRGIAWARRPRP